ncbi:aromatic ring-hydroxylating dioxygenase subunit alpha [Roseiarcaceae bacterium H3SJ34-1]|uniref:aromatic ring-hydroxylating oxygenase subunit alpha n=1 Tax=Terripilifer ovatus TaxID=3032367 RepID=UPI003AB9AD09|nr:aromatic ring-hydroxylating dioxygenase subunit alpha [Roseiarcaceae bacterium H3SJ34-1]
MPATADLEFLSVPREPSTGDTGRAASLISETEHRFRVHTAAYTKAEVLELEQQHIFRRAWCYVGHESELTKAGDFKTGHIGDQPILVTRSEDGGIHVMLNRCPHRGAVLCREPGGNRRALICPYHAWTFAIDGRLVSVTGRDDASGYSEFFEAPEGLYRVPRIETYRGFVFATLDAKAPALLDSLGRAKILIDRKLNQSPNGTLTIRSKPYVGIYEGNWKFHAENIIDGYHFMYTHQSFVKLQNKFGDTTGDFGVHKGGSASEMKKIRTRGSVWGCEGGHILNQKPAIDTQEMLSGPFAEYYQSIEKLYGAEEFQWIFGSNAGCIFPNFGMIHNQIRTWRPIAPDKTEVRIYLYDLDGAPPAFNEGMLRSQERFYGPSGHGMPDDIEIFAANQQGLSASQLEWLILERGMAAEKPLGDGDIEGLPSSETGHRAFWRAWRRSLSSGSGQ